MNFKSQIKGKVNILMDVDRGVTNRIAPVFAVVAGLLLGVSAHADFVFNNSGSFVNQSGNFILGDNFTVNVGSAISVSALGVFDQDAAVGGSIPVAIYELTSGVWTQVAGASANITGSDAVDVASQTRYTSITPVVLEPGQYSIVTVTASDYNSGNPNLGTSVVGFDSLGGAVSTGTYDIWNYYNGGVPPLGATLTGLNTTGPGNPNWPWPLTVFGAGTFSATVYNPPVPTAVPEPSTLIAGALLILPFGASALRVLRKNR